jgi:hypothetical protein
MAYDLTVLSPTDFEDLSRDLLQAEFGIRLESFTVGRDGGTDLRYSRSQDRHWIVQCKHFARSGWKALISKLQDEVQKVQRLAPERYILTTSVGLTPQNKDSLVTLFHPWITSSADIFGSDDIKNLLGRHPKVERAHFKLWLASTAILERILNGATFAKTDALIAELERQVRLYVSNDSFGRAVDILDSKRVCIIAGVPGIGKTFLARMLMLHHLQQGYEAYVLSADIDEANRIYDPLRHQFFYYDDFLGTAFDQALSKNEDARLAEFLQRVSHATNKRIVLTTREYILRRATSTYERLHSALERDLKCVVKLEDYTNFVRGRVLYNHLFFSKVHPHAVRRFCADRGYKDVIKHQNFSPRLIEFAIRHAEDKGLAQPLRDFLVSVLDTPAKLWDHAFKSQLSPEAKTILLAMTFMPSGVTIDDLAVAAASLGAVRGGATITGLEFASQIKNLEGTFVAIEARKPAARSARYFSPAIADYILGVLDDAPAELDSIMRSVTFFEQILAIWSAGQSRDAEGDSSGRSRYPGISRWLRANAPAVLAAAQRTLRAHSCMWQEHYAHGHLEYLRQPVRVEARLQKLFDIANALDAEELRSWSATQVKEISLGWINGDGDRAAAAALIGLVNVDEEVRLALKAWSLKGVDEAEDFEAALRFRDTAPDLVDEEFKARLSYHFELFVQSQEQYILEVADDAASARSALDDVESLARRLEMDPEWDEDELQERISDLETREDDFDADAARRAHSDVGGDSRLDDIKIDLLFDSLERSIESDDEDAPG